MNRVAKLLLILMVGVIGIATTQSAHAEGLNAQEQAQANNPLPT